MRKTDALELLLEQVLAHFEPLSTDEEARIWTALTVGQVRSLDVERAYRFFAPLAVKLAVQGFGRRLGGYEAAQEGLLALWECLHLYNPAKAGKVRFSLFLEAKLPQVLYRVVNGLEVHLSLDAETEGGTRYGELLAAPQPEEANDLAEQAMAALENLEGTTRHLLESFVARKPLSAVAQELGWPLEQTRQALEAALNTWREQTQSLRV